MPSTRRGVFSFRQLLLVGFVLIGALLGGTALRAVYVLDQLMAQSSDEAAAAIELRGNAQALTERTIDMERAARQSLILSDAVLRTRFEDEARNAQAALDRLVAGGLPQRHAQRWERQADSVRLLFAGAPETALERERVAASRFREYDTINSAIAREVQRILGERDRALRERLDATRSRLTQQVLLSIGLAAVLTAAFGVWLARPFKRLERAVVGLGENRLEEPIDIPGPADVRRLSQQLEWLRLRLTELDADKARFLRHVSHELKTPLAALREGVSLLEEGVTGELTPGQREVARILQHNTQVLQERIEALLRFNAAAFEARQLRRQPTDLLALLHDQVDAQRLQWQAQDLRVRVGGEPVMIAADADKLGAAVGNLLSNAIRFSPRGGAIDLVVATDGDRVRIDLRDEGPGIAPGDRDRIFEPFFRGERQPPDALAGTGIGLSIVQEYIAAHGGRVTLLPDSRGAHFQIELPRGA